MATKPERVCVRDCEGKLLIRWMISHDSQYGYITNDRGMRDMANDLKPQAIVGFPLTDIFRVPEGVGDENSSDLAVSRILSRF